MFNESFWENSTPDPPGQHIPGIPNYQPFCKDVQTINKWGSGVCFWGYLLEPAFWESQPPSLKIAQTAAAWWWIWNVRCASDSSHRKCNQESGVQPGTLPVYPKTRYHGSPTVYTQQHIIWGHGWSSSTGFLWIMNPNCKLKITNAIQGRFFCQLLFLGWVEGKKWCVSHL